MGTVFPFRLDASLRRQTLPFPSAWVQGEILNQAATEDQVLGESGKQMFIHKVQTNKEARHLGL